MVSVEIYDDILTINNNNNNNNSNKLLYQTKEYNNM